MDIASRGQSGRHVGWSALVLALMAMTPVRAATAPKIVTAPDAHGLMLTARTVLPAAPASAAAAKSCAHHAVAPKTDAGRLVLAKGWIVTGEARMGPFETVSFAAQLLPAPDGYGGGYCTAEQGNVGIFRGAALVAIAYAPRAAKAAIGRVVSREGGGVRIWNGDAIDAPVADLDVTDDTIRLGGLAAHETVCVGKAMVPNIYGMPVDKARTALIASGWSPVPHKDGPPAPGQEQDLAKHGIIEVSGCSEGLDFCGFDYRSGDVGLSVTTMGDARFPAVTGYSAQCKQ